MGHDSNSKKDSAQQRENQWQSAGSVARRTVLKSSAIAGSLGIIGFSQSATAASGDAVCTVPAFDCGESVSGTDGVVVSDSPEASTLGAEVLRSGGNAVDAAVTVHLALDVVNQHSQGIGGGGTMLYYDADTDDVTHIDFYPRAPSSATPEYWLDEDGEPNVQSNSGRSAGLPGTLKGLEEAHERYGSRPWQRLISPVVDLAQNGVEVDAPTAEAIANNWDQFNDAARDTFSGPDGKPLDEGDELVQERLAEAYKKIRRDGSKPFYEGEIAEALVETVQRHDGEMTVDDLAEFEVRIREPMHATYKDIELYHPRLPITSGFLVPQTLKQLERFELGENYDVQSAEKHHLFAESAGLAWADRVAYTGDDEFVDVPEEGLQSEEFIEERSALLSVDETLADYDAGECVEPGDPWKYQSGNEESMTKGEATPTEGSTTHFSIADADGNLAVVTTSINALMGSSIMVPEYQIMLNDYLVLFDPDPESPNAPEGGKGPLSSTSPTIVMRDGEPFFTSGSPGGTTIPQTASQIILNVVEYGMDIDEAVREPRITRQECPPIGWEDGIPESAREGSSEIGQVWEDTPGDIGNANNLLIDEAYNGAADPRRDSFAVGFSRTGR